MSQTKPVDRGGLLLRRVRLSGAATATEARRPRELEQRHSAALLQSPGSYSHGNALLITRRRRACPQRSGSCQTPHPPKLARPQGRKDDSVNLRSFSLPTRHPASPHYRIVCKGSRMGRCGKVGAVLQLLHKTCTSDICRERATPESPSPTFWHGTKS